MLHDLTHGTGRTTQHGRSGLGLSPDGVWMAKGFPLKTSSVKDAGEGLRGCQRKGRTETETYEQRLKPLLGT